jgi:mono/diheme cytochrome c family protein
MRIERLVTGFVAVAILGGGVWGAKHLSGVGETRGGSHSHAAREFLAQNGNQPPLLDYIPTYYKHVAPILERSCVGCHSDGNIAPFSLDTPKAAVDHARGIQKAVQTRFMPPIRAGGATLPLLHDRRLTDEEIAIVANWSWAGAPLGKKSDAAPLSNASSNPKRTPDLVISSPAEFTPDAALSDEYRCFVVDPKLSQQTFLNGYNILPGNKRIVHHVLLYQIPQRDAGRVRQLEAETRDGRPGYPCFGGSGLTGAQPSILGAWAPGQSRVDYPIGTGAALEAGDLLVMQMHYNLLAGRDNDRSTAELYFSKSPVKALFSSNLVVPVEIPCPGAYPSDQNHPCHREAAYRRAEINRDGTTAFLRNGLVLTFCKRQLEEFTSGSNGAVTATCEFPLRFDESMSIGVYGVLGHMHLLGTSFKLELIRDAKATTVLEIPQWDFHWQSSYWLRDPVRLRNGDTVRVTCKYDNRAERQPEVNGRRVTPRYVVWGEGTLDEMCLTIAQVGGM